MKLRRKPRLSEVKHCRRGWYMVLCNGGVYRRRWHWTLRDMLFA